MTIPEFFKIFLTDDSEQLDLPKKFVRRHGEAISNTVFLKLPYGQKWEIGLLKSDGKVYLHQGWPKFVKHYRLDYGHLLYFRYEGNSHFGVSIFCLANCRVDYPSIPAQSDGNPTLPRNKETEEDASILQPNSPTHKRMKTCATGKLRKSKGSRGTYKSYKNSRAFEKASSFSSSNPFFIRIVRGYRRACYSMRLPDNFIKGHLERKTQIVKLQVGMQY